jgi:hypothetical protein
MIIALKLLLLSLIAQESKDVSSIKMFAEK